MIDAINKKESSFQYLADLQKIREAYVQDVKENYSNNSIPDNQDTVNNKKMQDSENNGISTVYNVGKMKAEDIPNGNIVSAIGSKADMSSANSSVTQKPSTVNSKYTQESGNNSKNNLQFSFARVWI